MGIVKYIQNTLQKNTTSHRGEKFTPRIGKNTRVFGAAEEMRKSFQQYFGFDIGDLGNFSVDDFISLAKSAEEARKLEEHKDVIEENIKDYINGTVQFNQLVARCVKQGAAGMEKIDQATFDTWAGWRGWQTHSAKLSHKASITEQKLGYQAEQDQSFEEFGLEKYKQMAAYKMNRKREEVVRKMLETQGTDEVSDLNAEFQRLANRDRKQAEDDLADLLKYGEIRYRDANSESRAVPVELQTRKNGRWTGVGRFFNGG